MIILPETKLCAKAVNRCRRNESPDVSNDKFDTLRTFCRIRKNVIYGKDALSFASDHHNVILVEVSNSHYTHGVFVSLGFALGAKTPWV